MRSLSSPSGSARKASTPARPSVVVGPSKKDRYTTKAAKAELHAQIFAYAIFRRPFTAHQIHELKVASYEVAKRELVALKDAGLLRRNGDTYELLPGSKLLDIFAEAVMMDRFSVIHLLDYVIARAEKDPRHDPKLGGGTRLETMKNTRAILVSAL